MPAQECPSPDIPEQTWQVHHSRHGDSIQGHSERCYVSRGWITSRNCPLKKNSNPGMTPSWRDWILKWEKECLDQEKLEYCFLANLNFPASGEEIYTSPELFEENRSYIFLTHLSCGERILWLTVFMFPEYPFDSTPSHFLKDISGGSPIIFFIFYFWRSYSSHFRETQCALDLGFQSLCGLGPPYSLFPSFLGWVVQRGFPLCMVVLQPSALDSHAWSTVLSSHGRTPLLWVVRLAPDGKKTLICIYVYRVSQLPSLK